MAKSKKSKRNHFPETASRASADDQHTILDRETRRWKRIAAGTALLGVLVGSGGLWGVFQWLHEAPSQRAESELTLLVKTHEAKVASLRSSIDARRELGEPAAATELLRILDDTERTFRSVLEHITMLTPTSPDRQPDDAWLQKTHDDLIRNRDTNVELLRLIKAVEEDSRSG